MDLDALHSTLLSIAVVSEKVRKLCDLSAEEKGQVALAKALHEVETDLRLAKATLAAELGFSLCPRCWPPELVTSEADGRINCPSCGVISFEQAA